MSTTPPLPNGTHGPSGSREIYNAVPVAEPANWESAAMEYESPMYVRRPPSSALYWLAIIGWAIAAGVAVLLFLTTLITQRFELVIFGFLWIYVGGFITFAALVLGIVYGSLALSAGFPPPASRRRAIFAWLLPLSNVALAVLLIIGGVTWIQNNKAWMPPVAPVPATTPSTPTPGFSSVTLELTNGTSTTIDKAGVILPTGRRIEVGPIGANQQVTRLVTLEGEGAVMINCTPRGGVRWSQVLLPYVVNGEADQGSIAVTLQPPTRTP